ISTRGEFFDLTDPDQLRFAVDKLNFTSTKSAVASLIDESELGISIPESIDLQAQAHGKLNDLKAKAFLQIPEGKIKVDGQFKNADRLAFSANLDVDDLALGKLLENPDIGTLAFTMQA